MINTENTMTEYLPQVRCTYEMKTSLEAIASNSVARNISDHIRYAVEQYIASHKNEVQREQFAEAVPA